MTFGGSWSKKIMSLEGKLTLDEYARIRGAHRYPSLM